MESDTDEVCRRAIVGLTWLSLRAGEGDPQAAAAHDRLVAAARAHGMVTPFRPGRPVERLVVASPEPLPSLAAVAAGIQALARRYAHGRSSVAASGCNRLTAALVAAGADLDDGDGTVWALDGMGALYDGLGVDERHQAVTALRRAGHLVPASYRG